MEKVEGTEGSGKDEKVAVQGESSKVEE